MRLLMFVLLVCVVVVCLACGGGGSSTPSTPSAPVAPTPPKTYLDPSTLKVGQVGHFKEDVVWAGTGEGDVNFVSVGFWSAKQIVTVRVPRKLVRKLASDVLVDSNQYVLPGEWKVVSADQFKRANQPKFDLMPNP